MRMRTRPDAVARSPECPQRSPLPRQPGRKRHRSCATVIASLLPLLAAPAGAQYAPLAMGGIATGSGIIAPCDVQISRAVNTLNDAATSPTSGASPGGNRAAPSSATSYGGAAGAAPDSTS